MIDLTTPYQNVKYQYLIGMGTRQSQYLVCISQHA